METTPAKLSVQEALVECGVVRDQGRIANELKQLMGDFAKALVVTQKLKPKPVHAHDLLRDVAIGVEIGVKLASRALEIEHLNATDLDNAITHLFIFVVGEDAGGFRVEQDFAHVVRG